MLYSSSSSKKKKWEEWKEEEKAEREAQEYGQEEVKQSNVKWRLSRKLSRSSTSAAGRASRTDEARNHLNTHKIGKSSNWHKNNNIIYLKETIY